MSVSAKGMQLLYRIDDYAIKGQYVTPATESYSELKSRRAGIGSVEAWTQFEAVHINAAEKSLKAAYRYLHIKGGVPKFLVDRVLVMDFDNFDKQGRMKGDKVITIQDLLSDLKKRGMVMPYCILETETKGNFHVMWVFRFCQSRNYVRKVLPALYAQWGCDERFTNSTMRNPLFLEKHKPERLHWWDEWVSEEPLLDEASQLLKERIDEKFYLVPDRIPEEKLGKFRYRMTLPQLEKAMSEAVPGDNRWMMLRSWTTRFIMSNYKGTAITSRSLAKNVRTINSKFKVPLESWRVNQLIRYWTPANQSNYVARQISAGISNPNATPAHEEAVVKYFEVAGMRDRLNAFLRGEKGSLTAQEAYRVESYTGTAQAPNKRATHALIAYMLNVQPTEKINKKTGEVTVVSPDKQIRSTLSNGKNLKYTKKEYNEIIARSEEVFDLEESEEVIDELTGEVIPSTLDIIKSILDSGKSTRKGSSYVCWTSPP